MRGLILAHAFDQATGGPFPQTLIFVEDRRPGDPYVGVIGRLFNEQLDEVLLHRKGLVLEEFEQQVVQTRVVHVPGQFVPAPGVHFGVAGALEELGEDLADLLLGFDKRAKRRSI